MNHAESPLSFPLPQEGVTRVRRLAYYLAWGAVNAWWYPRFEIFSSVLDRSFGPYRPTDALTHYLQEIWALDDDNLRQLFHLMQSFGFMNEIEHIPDGVSTWQLTEKAFALLEEAPPVSIFISYRRSTSSALAMYIWAELRNVNFNPFLDIRSIAPGDEWLSLLEKRVKSSNVFIAVLGKNTLESDYVRQEIEWALATPGTRLIPILHGGFTPEALTSQFPLLAQRNLIVVTEDISAEFYGAMEQLKSALWLVAGREG